MNNLTGLPTTSLPGSYQLVAGLLFFATVSTVPVVTSNIDVPKMFKDGSISFAENHSDDSLTSSVASFHNEITLDSINCGARHMRLASEIILKIRQEDEYFIIDYPSLGIYVAESSYDNAIDAFNEDFLFVWDTYASEEDDKLTDDAKDLKKMLNSLVL